MRLPVTVRERLRSTVGDTKEAQSGATIILVAFLFTVLLGFAAVMMLPACSSTEEAPPPAESSGGSTGDTGDLEDCSVYTNQVDIRECEVRNSMRQ